MTTPAVSIDSKQFGVGYSQVFYADGHSDAATPSGTPLWKSKSEHRPVSVSTVKSASGWRSPTRFWHYGSHSNPCPKTAFALEYNPSPYAYTVRGDGFGWNNTVYGLQGLPDYLKDVAVTKALLGLKNQKVNLAQAFAEREQLVNLTYQAANGCVSLISKFISLHRNRFTPRELMNMTLQKAKELTKQRNSQGLLQNFLAVQYGVRPLMQDVYGAADALNKRERSADAYRATVHGRAAQKISTTWWKGSGFSGDFGYLCDVRESHHAHVRLDYVLDNPILASLSQLGITNPVNIAWELTKLSFVVDWFLPVGSYLQCFDAALGWTFKGGSLDTISRNTVVGSTAVLRGTQFPFHRVLSNDPYNESNYHFERYPYDYSPLPQVPRFKNPLSGQHIANAIALIFAAIPK